MENNHLEQHLQRIETLDPVNRLPRRDRDALLRHARTLARPTGELVYRQGDRDDFVHFLLEGSVDLLWDGKLVKTVRSTQEAADHPLDGSGPKLYSARAKESTVVLRVARAQLDHALRMMEAGPASDTTEVKSIDADAARHWMSRMLQSGVYPQLPASNIQLLFSRMDQVAMRAGDPIIKQGDVGHHYYVVHSGAVEVVRDLPGRGPVRLALLGPGETFGEEALISGSPRNATVRSTSDGFLMRLGKQDFLELICSPLMRALDFEQARALVRRGATWLDVRFQEEFLAGSLPDAINMPLSVLRIKSSTLAGGATYIVCSDTPTMSAVGAFLLAERGIDVCYLNDRIQNHIQSALMKIVEGAKPVPPEGPPNVVTFPARSASSPERDKPSSNERGTAMSTPDDNAPPVATPPAGQELGNTVTGRALASLINEIETQRKQIGVEQPRQGEPSVHNAIPIQELDPLEKTANTVRAIVDAAVDAELATTSPPVVTPVAENTFATLVREIESKLRSLVDEHARNYRERVNAEVAARTNRIKEAAVNEIRRNAQELKRRYQQALADKETRLAERERTLQANYDKLMTLATRIGRQKSEINAQRRLLDEKLKAAADLHREVHEIGQLVSNRIDDLEVIMREAS